MPLNHFRVLNPSLTANRPNLFRHGFGYFLFGLLGLLSSCSFGATPPPPATSIPVALPTADTPSAPTASAPAAELTRWRVGLLDRPSNLLPFSPDGRAAAPIVEALFPAPILTQGYAFTTTGILERVPSLANGDVREQKARGFLDASGQFTTTVTEQITTTSQLVVTFRWRRDLRWSDGTPVTAADSVWAYQQARASRGLTEATAVLDLLADYREVDDHTTEAVLPAGRTDPAYALTAWPPLPRHILADQGRDVFDRFTRAPIGYGPYSTAVQTADAITLHRNPYWPAAEALPDELVFRFFATADELRTAVARQELDVGVLEQVPPDLYPFLDQDQATGATNISYLPGPIYEHLDFNLAEPQLQDLRVRQAIAYAIDRATLSRDLFGGKSAVLHSWILPEQAEYAGDEQLTRYGFAPERAEALLAASGLVDRDGDGLREAADSTPLTLTLLTTASPLRGALVERVAADLAAVGLRVQTTPLPTEALYSATGPLFRREFQLAVFAWIAEPLPGGVPLWSCAAVPSAQNGYTGNNFSGWCFEPAEQPLRRGAAALNERERAAQYLRQQQAWAQELPSLVLVQRPLITISQPYVQGLAPDPLAPITWNVQLWRRQS